MKNDAILETLRGALHRIEDKRRWTRGGLARDAAGHLVRPDDPRACQWCPVAAIELCAPTVRVAMDSAKALGVPFLPEWNDSHTHTQVVKLFRRAIQRLES